MECPLLEGTLEGDPRPVSTLERRIRRRKVIIYRPAPEELGSPVLRQKPLERGRTSPLPCADAGRSPSKRQRLRQGSPPRVERHGWVCGKAGETLWRVASPMEKQQRRALAVGLEDFSITQVPEDPPGCPPLQRPTTSLRETALSPAAVSGDVGSRPATGRSSAIGRLCPATGNCPPCQEPRERLTHACRQLWDWRPSPPQCRESERLQAKRQRLQKGVPLANGTNGARASPPDQAPLQIVTVGLEDGALSQALDAGAGKEQLETSPPPCRSDQLTSPPQSPSLDAEKPAPSVLGEHSHQTGASSEARSSWPPPVSTLLRPSAPPRFRQWGLAPVFQTMRSKLEAFADIFLSPSKPALPSAEGTTPSLPPGPRGNADQAAAQAGTPRQGVNIEVKIAISEPRPRKRGCPHEAEEEEEEPGSVVLRQRRHTVCSLEVSRELGRPTPPCLRKEVYPFSTPPSRLLLGPLGHVPHYDSSSYTSPVPSCCHESDPVCSRDISPSPDGRQKGARIGLDVADSELVTSEQMMFSETEMKGSQENTMGKVSCIRIRKTPARQQANLTPMGLPRPVRLNKKEFSLEEIYTNKNYRTPTEKRSFETIFEVPLERNGALVFTSQRKLKRAVEFREGGLPRKQRKARSRGGRRAGGGRRRLPQAPELEEMLQQRLAELDALFEQEEEEEG
ncbi:proline-rich protein 14 isoform X2 [Elgaria multicarinata webbii]|uniref:proline-rich protein 14 isoform X2 n=1 Tax=Elgaria multicarinata webbii TaxID=159646 RepID=UPI002FCCCA76